MAAADHHVLWGKSQVFIFFSSVVSPVTCGKMQKCQWNVIKMTTIWTSWSQTFFVTFSNIHKPWFNLIKMAAVCREHEGWHDRFPKPLKRHENVPTPQICNKFLSTSNCLFPSPNFILPIGFK
jgi:hypothetical protein